MSLALTPAIVTADQDFDAVFRAYESAVAARDDQQIAILAQQLFDLGPSRFEAGSEDMAALGVNLGMALDNIREHEAARDVLETAKRQYIAIDRKHPGLIEVYLALGKNWSFGTLDKSKSRRFYSEAIDLSEDHYGTNSIETADVKLRVGTVLLEFGRSRRAESYLEGAWGVYSDVLGETDAKTGESAFYLGKFHLSAGEPEAAEEWLNRAIVAFEADTQASERLEMTTRAFLVDALERQGRSDEATAHCQAIGRMSPAVGAQERQPLFKPQLDILRLLDRKATRQLMRKYDGKGEIEVAFTVDEMGFVQNPRIVQNNIGEEAAEASLKTVKRFRYAPRFVDGEPVVSEDRYRLAFTITRSPESLGR